MECAILCGGRSRRMGTDKARLPWQGREIVDILAERLCRVGPVVLSVGRPGQLAGKPYPQLTDRFPDTGPLGGLYTILSASQEDLVFAAACDMPFVTAETALALARALPEAAEAAVPITPDGWVHPLCALYRASACQALREQLLAGDFRLRSALARLRTVYVPAAELPGGATALVNLNTMAAYQAACGEYAYV